MQDLPLPELAVFVAVAETEGFSAAARRLGVSKAMVSVAIARLEDRLSVRLLHRTTRRLSLTEAGAATVPHAQRALLAARDAAEAATAGLASPRGVLRVNAPMTFGLLHVVPVLGELATRYPELRVDLSLDDRVIDLAEGGFDLAIRIGTLADSALVAQRIGHSRNVLVATPQYLARHGTPDEPLELAEHAVLTYSLSTTGVRWQLSRGARSEHLRVSGRIQANSSLALHAAVRQHLGIARVPLFVVAEDLAAGTLVQVLPTWTFAEQGIYVLTATRDVPRKTRAFVELLRERIGSPPVWERPAAPERRRRAT